ncbi:MAG: ATP-binding protein [Oligoflexales bacterium]
MQKKLSLKDAIQRSGASGSSTAPVSRCALAKALECCGGRGYSYKIEGAFVQAQKCDCVKNCSECFGRARKTENGFSKPCREPNPSVVMQNINTASIPARYCESQLKKFSNFTGSGQKVVKQVGQWFVQYMKSRSGPGMIIHGPVGVGKTYLLAALAKGLLERGVSVKFVDFFDLLSQLRNAYTQNQADKSILEPLTTVEVLFIDELGKGRNSEWELSIIDQLVMGRYNQNKVIIASTNYGLARKTEGQRWQMPLDHFETPKNNFQTDQFDSLEVRVGQRIFSRLVEICEITELTGNDFRKSRLAQSEGLVVHKVNELYE